MSQITFEITIDFEEDHDGPDPTEKDIEVIVHDGLKKLRFHPDAVEVHRQ
jgi:hypothetical protein